MAQGVAGFDEAKRFEAQQIVLTVPASFDEVARELTLQAADAAGLGHAVLLEEPLAAFYAWLARHEADWQGRMHDGQLILICDVGGGTTDFSTIGVRAGAAGLRFDRLAVGEHLMLGGDNMDLALGRQAETAMFGAPGKLDAQRWHQLVYQCRRAKEILLDPQARQSQVDVTLVGAGSQLIAAARKTTLTAQAVERLILDGFFPLVERTATPQESRRAGLTELGLPYVQDPAVTRHLAAFWQRYAGLLHDETGRADVFPDYVLFNGGALAPQPIRDRLHQLLQQWFRPAAGEAWEAVELANPHPELAVARGAAYYGLVRLGLGVRVGSGSPRAYYVGVELGTATRAAPVAADDGDGDAAVEPAPTLAAVCLLPRGTEEGFQMRLEQPDFVALTNQPVAFRIFTSSTRVGDHLGEIVALAPDQVTELPPIQTVLRFGRKEKRAGCRYSWPCD